MKARQILKVLFRNATSAMFQNKKLKRNAISAIAEVAEVALCASNCALPTSATLQHLCIYHTTRLLTAVGKFSVLIEFEHFRRYIERLH